MNYLRKHIIIVLNCIKMEQLGSQDIKWRNDWQIIVKIFETIDELKSQFKKFLFKLFVLKIDYKSLLINYKFKILIR